MLVAHDPGHGAPPAIEGCKYNGIIERDLTLSLSLDIAAGIPWVGHILLRQGAKGDPYIERAQRALKARAGIVLCHHINAYGKANDVANPDGTVSHTWEVDPTTHGLITFYDPGDTLGQAVAEIISTSAPLKLRREKRGIFPARPDDWTRPAHWVLEHYRELGLPAVLIEWGHATSPEDAKFLLDPNCRPCIVATAAAGIACAMEKHHG